MKTIVILLISPFWGIVFAPSSLRVECNDKKGSILNYANDRFENREIPFLDHILFNVGNIGRKIFNKKQENAFLPLMYKEKPSSLMDAKEEENKKGNNFLGNVIQNGFNLGKNILSETIENLLKFLRWRENKERPMNLQPSYKYLKRASDIQASDSGTNENRATIIKDMETIPSFVKERESLKDAESSSESKKEREEMEEEEELLDTAFDEKNLNAAFHHEKVIKSKDHQIVPEVTAPFNYESKNPAESEHIELSILENKAKEPEDYTKNRLQRATHANWHNVAALADKVAASYHETLNNLLRDKRSTFWKNFNANGADKEVINGAHINAILNNEATVAETLNSKTAIRRIIDQIQKDATEINMHDLDVDEKILNNAFVTWLNSDIDFETPSLRDTSKIDVKKDKVNAAEVPNIIAKSITSTKIPITILSKSDTNNVNPQTVFNSKKTEDIYNSEEFGIEGENPISVIVEEKTIESDNNDEELLKRTPCVFIDKTRLTNITNFSEKISRDEVSDTETMTIADTRTENTNVYIPSQYSSSENGSIILKDIDEAPSVKSTLKPTSTFEKSTSTIDTIDYSTDSYISERTYDISSDVSTNSEGELTLIESRRRKDKKLNARNLKKDKSSGEDSTIEVTDKSEEKNTVNAVTLSNNKSTSKYTDDFLTSVSDIAKGLNDDSCEGQEESSEIYSDSEYTSECNSNDVSSSLNDKSDRSYESFSEESAGTNSKELPATNDNKDLKRILRRKFATMVEEASDKSNEIEGYYPTVLPISEESYDNENITAVTNNEENDDVLFWLTPEFSIRNSSNTARKSSITKYIEDNHKYASKTNFAFIPSNITDIQEYYRNTLTSINDEDFLNVDALDLTTDSNFINNALFNRQRPIQFSKVIDNSITKGELNVREFEKLTDFGNDRNSDEHKFDEVYKVSLDLPTTTVSVKSDIEKHFNSANKMKVTDVKINIESDEMERSANYVSQSEEEMNLSEIQSTTSQFQINNIADTIDRSIDNFLPKIEINKIQSRSFDSTEEENTSNVESIINDKPKSYNGINDVTISHIKVGTESDYEIVNDVKSNIVEKEKVKLDQDYIGKEDTRDTSNKEKYKEISSNNNLPTTSKITAKTTDIPNQSAYSNELHDFIDLREPIDTNEDISNQNYEISLKNVGSKKLMENNAKNDETSVNKNSEDEEIEESNLHLISKESYYTKEQLSQNDIIVNFTTNTKSIAKEEADTNEKVNIDTRDTLKSILQTSVETENNATNDIIENYPIFRNDIEQSAESSKFYIGRKVTNDAIDKEHIKLSSEEVLYLSSDKVVDIDEGNKIPLVIQDKLAYATNINAKSKETGSVIKSYEKWNGLTSINEEESTETEKEIDSIKAITNDDSRGTFETLFDTVTVPFNQIVNSDLQISENTFDSIKLTMEKSDTLHTKGKDKNDAINNEEFINERVSSVEESNEYLSTERKETLKNHSKNEVTKMIKNIRKYSGTKSIIKNKGETDLEGSVSIEEKIAPTYDKILDKLTIPINNIEVENENSINLVDEGELTKSYNKKEATRIVSEESEKAKIYVEHANEAVTYDERTMESGETNSRSDSIKDEQQSEIRQKFPDDLFDEAPNIDKANRVTVNIDRKDKDSSSERLTTAYTKLDFSDVQKGLKSKPVETTLVDKVVPIKVVHIYDLTSELDDTDMKSRHRTRKTNSTPQVNTSEIKGASVISTEDTKFSEINGKEKSITTESTKTSTFEPLSNFDNTVDVERVVKIDIDENSAEKRVDNISIESTEEKKVQSDRTTEYEENLPKTKNDVFAETSVEISTPNDSENKSDTNINQNQSRYSYSYSNEQDWNNVMNKEKRDGLLTQESSESFSNENYAREKITTNFDKFRDLTNFSSGENLTAISIESNIEDSHNGARKQYVTSGIHADKMSNLDLKATNAVPTEETANISTDNTSKLTFEGTTRPSIDDALFSDIVNNDERDFQNIKISSDNSMENHSGETESTKSYAKISDYESNWKVNNDITNRRSKISVEEKPYVYREIPMDRIVKPINEVVPSYNKPIKVYTKADSENNEKRFSDDSFPLLSSQIDIETLTRSKANIPTNARAVHSVNTADFTENASIDAMNNIESKLINQRDNQDLHRSTNVETKATLVSRSDKISTDLSKTIEIDRSASNGLFLTQEEARKLSQMPNDVDMASNVEIFVAKKASTGPIGLTHIKDTIPPLVVYRLIPRRVYEEMRRLLTKKGILYDKNNLS